MARNFDNIEQSLRAEIYVLVAHLVGLSLADMAPILSTFPIVAPEEKEAALQVWNDMAEGRIV